MDAARAGVIAFVGIGANLGDPVATVTRAFDALAALPGTRVDARSSLYRTAPVGCAEQPDFVNAVARLRTALAPEELLGHLLSIERAHGRMRSSRNAPRTLDLDLLLYGAAVIDREGITVPHPRMHERGFVLAPLAEIDARATVPGRGEAAALLARVGLEGVERIAGG
jgi:2-amino-4-hydroxy-6-hydroxymethyldihydropteridine diphosphokinase